MQAEAAGRRGTWPAARTVISTLARLVMAGVFIWAGLSKITDIELAKLSVESYQIFPREIAFVIFGGSLLVGASQLRLRDRP